MIHSHLRTSTHFRSQISLSLPTSPNRPSHPSNRFFSPVSSPASPPSAFHSPSIFIQRQLCIFPRGVTSGRKRTRGRVKRHAISAMALPGPSLIGPEATRTIWAILFSCAAIGQSFEVHTWVGARLSSPMMSLFLGMMLSTLNIIPSTSLAYDSVWKVAMPLAVALLLLETDVRRAFTEAGPTLKAFWIGALSTILGTLLAFLLVGPALGPDGWKMASCLCATYIGGGINFVGTAQALGLPAGSLLAAAIAADNLITALYAGIMMALPERWPGQVAAREEGEGEEEEEAGGGGGRWWKQMPPLKVRWGWASGFFGVSPPPTVETLSLSLAVASSACALSAAIAPKLPTAIAGLELGVTAVLASLASTLVAAGTNRKRAGGGGGGGAAPPSSRVPAFAGAESLGGLLMLVFFAVIGAGSGFLEAISAGWHFLAFISLQLATHLSLLLAAGYFLRLPLKAVLVASNANVGGPATAAAMAATRKWPDLVRPALLTGTLGYTVGTAIGCLVGLKILKPMAAWQLGLGP